MDVTDELEVVVVAELIIEVFELGAVAIEEVVFVVIVVIVYVIAVAVYLVETTKPGLVMSENGIIVIHALDEVDVVLKYEVVVSSTLHPAVALQVVL